MTRNGKIARLPRCFREDLNQRLSDGEQGKSLVTWLNTNSEVQEVLELYFDGRPITEQNLSEWKQGGYQEWLRHQENLEWSRHAVEEAEELAGDEDPMPLSDRMGPLAALALGKLIRTACSTKLDSPADRLELLEVIRELTALRGSDHRAARLKMDFRRWEEECAKLEKDAQRRELWEPIEFLQMVQSREQFVSLMAGGGTPEQEQKLRDHLKVGPRKTPRAEAPAAGSAAAAPPAQSDPIQVNPTASNQPTP